MTANTSAKPAADGEVGDPGLELYKRYRPKSLDEVRCQDAAVKALRSMLGRRQVPHAILFSGPSGCGKTTLARILARGLGCKRFDFHEINAAEARGIDTVRDIQARMTLAPAGACRVYLVDECHRLTNDAQSALLKTLEDTPRHVYFFLPTTDPRKLLNTIRTRCTDVKVEAFKEADLRDLVADVAAKEGYTLAADVLAALAEAADGSPRKALVILNQIRHLPPAEQLSGIHRADEKRLSIDLCRALMNNRGGWAPIAKMLTQVEDEDPEGLRRAVLGYARKVLLGGGRSGQLAAAVISAFRGHVYDDGHAGLAIAAWQVHGEVSQMK